MKAPAFQFYPQDFISSLDVQVMNVEQVGAYILLLSNAWIHDPQGYLPNNDLLLQRICRMNDKQWTKNKSLILKKFEKTGELIFNGRLIKELEKQAENRKKQAENGRKGGRPKANQKPKKAVGYSGETQTEPKKSSSSSSSISSSNNTSLHTFSESPYADNPTLFKAQFCPKQYQFVDLDYYYNLLKEKGDKYKYENWIDAAVGWMQRDKKRNELQMVDPKPYSPATKAEQDALWGEVNPDFKPNAA